MGVTSTADHSDIHYYLNYCNCIYYIFTFYQLLNTEILLLLEMKSERRTKIIDT